MSKDNLTELKKQLKELDNRYNFSIPKFTIGQIKEKQSLTIMYSKYSLISWMYGSEIQKGTFDLDSKQDMFKTGVVFIQRKTQFWRPFNSSLIGNSWKKIAPHNKPDDENYFKLIPKKLLPFFDSITNEIEKNDLIDTFCYQSFPALFYYFTIGNFIHFAYEMIEIVGYKALYSSNEINKTIFGKMCSAFFAGFFRISSTFTQLFFNEWKTKSDIQKKVQNVINKLPIVLTFYHIKIIKLMKNHPNLFLEHILKNVLFRNFYTIISNDINYKIESISNLYRNSIPCDDFIKMIINECENYLTNISTENVNSLINSLLSDDGTDVYLPNINEIGINDISHYITFKEINLLIKIINFQRTIQNLEELNALQQINSTILKDKFNIDQSSEKEEDKKKFENYIVEFETSFPLIEKSSQSKINCENSKVKTIISYLENCEMNCKNPQGKNYQIPYSNFFEDESKWDCSSQIAYIIKSIKGTPNEEMLIKILIEQWQIKKEQLELTLKRKRFHQLYDEYTNDVAQYAKIHLKVIGTMISKTFSFPDKPQTFSGQIEGHSVHFLWIFVPYIALNLVHKINYTPEYINIIQNSKVITNINDYICECNNKIDYKQLKPLTFGIYDSQSPISYFFIDTSACFLQSLSEIKDCSFMERYSALILIIKQIQELVSISGIKKELVKKRMIITTFLNIYFKSKANCIFITYAQLSKLLKYNSFEEALSYDEPNYKELLSYIDEAFHEEIFPSCQSAETAFNEFLEIPLTKF